MAEPRIVNLVGSIAYPQELDLRALAQTFESLEAVRSVVYQPSDANWIRSRFGDDETYVAFYRTGRCTITGLDDFKTLQETADLVNEVMGELLSLKEEPDLVVDNIVALTDLGRSFSLDQLAIALGLEQTEYEPEQFSGLIYRPERGVILVFSTGKVVCTGLREWDDVLNVIDDFCSSLTDFGLL